MSDNLGKCDTEEGVFLLNKIEVILREGITFGGILHENNSQKGYIDIIKVMYEFFPRDSINNYYQIVFRNIMNRTTKPSAMRTSIYTLVIDEIFNSENVFEDIRERYKDVKELSDMFQDIETQYEIFTAELVRTCVLENTPLASISDAIITDKQRVKKLLEIDKVTLIKYLENIIQKVLANIKKPIKRSDVITALVVEELFGNRWTVNQIIYKDHSCVEVNELLNKIKEQYLFMVKKVISTYMQERIPLSSIGKLIVTDTDKFNIFFSFPESKIIEYLDSFAVEYLKSRKTINFWEFTCNLFAINSLGNLKYDNINTGYYEFLKQYVDEKYGMYGELLVESNDQEIRHEKDIWCLFYKRGPKYNSRKFDFSDILSKEFKYEIKLYIMDELKRKKIDVINTMQLVVECVNYMYKDNPCINSFGRIRQEDIVKLYRNLVKNYITIQNNKLRPASIQKMIKRLGLINKFLIKYAKRNRLMTVLPEVDYFEKIKFSNIKNMHKNTDIIPEIVIKQIEKYKNELSPRHLLIYDVFANSGVRLKEVTLLEEDCLDDTEWDNFKILKYTPYKVENIAKIKGRSGRNEIIIPKQIATNIEVQREVTSELREKYLCKNIFIHLNDDFGKVRANITCGKGFIKAINSLIKKHNIIDLDNNIWHFTSRQMRKTLVVTMIENGATNEEIVYVLGHYNYQTLEKYYEDVREKKLEDMHCEFFKNKFKIVMGEKNLNNFTEEERRILYIDFISDYRKGDLGYCSRHYSEGICEEASCAKCEKICTGKQFLNEWIVLRDSQQKIIKQLEDHYNAKKINFDIYNKFKEYQTEVYNLNLYQDIIDKTSK